MRWNDVVDELVLAKALHSGACVVACTYGVLRLLLEQHRNHVGKDGRHLLLQVGLIAKIFLSDAVCGSIL